MSILALQDKIHDLPDYYMVIDWSATGASGVTYNSNRLASFSGIESESGDDTLGNIESANVVINDNNGDLLSIYQTYPIEGAIAEIYIKVGEEAQRIFTGKVTAPITFDDAAQTLSISLLSRVEGKLISAYDDSITDNEDVEYQEPPICFGTVLGVKCAPTTPKVKLTLMSKIKHSVTRGDGAKIYTSTDTFYIRNGELLNGTTCTLLIDGALFTGTFSGNLFTCVTGGFNVGYALDIATNDRPTTHTQVDNPSVIFSSNAVGDLANKYIKLGWQELHTVDPTGKIKLPNGFNGRSPTNIHMGQAVYVQSQDGTACGLDLPVTNKFGEQYLLGGEGTIDEVKGRPDYSWDMDLEKYPSQWEIRPGTRVEVYTAPMQTLYANWLPSSKVHGVYGYYDGALTLLPTSYYGVTLTPRTTITVNRSLLQLGWDSDEVYASLTSSVGPNVSTVLQYIITNYVTGINSVDAASFAAIEAAHENYPVGFAITEGEDSLSVLKGMLWEAHLAMRIVDNVAYLIDQAVAPSVADYTITSDKTEFPTVRQTTTDSPDIYTVFKFKWRPTYFPDDFDHKVYYTKNNDKFGTRKFDYTYRYYNRKQCVTSSSNFWAERYGNIWCLLLVKTFLTSIDTAAYTPVGIDLDNVIATTGIVKRMSLSTGDSDSIELEVWTPVSNSGGSPWASLNDDPIGGIYDFGAIDFALNAVVPSSYNLARKKDDAITEGDSRNVNVESAENNVATFMITEVLPDGVRAVKVNKDDYTTPTAEEKASADKVAFWADFQSSTYKEKEVNGITWNTVTYTDTKQFRQGTDANNKTVVQEIYPPYYVGALIQANYSPKGVGVAKFSDDDTPPVWVDMNASGRAWVVTDDKGLLCPFKIIIDDETSTVKVVNGFNYDDTVAGFAMFNGRLWQVQSDIVVGATPGYVLLTATLGSDDTITFGYDIDANVTDYNTASKVGFPLGYISTNPATTIGLWQYPNNVPIMMLTGDCEDESAT